MAPPYTTSWPIVATTENGATWTLRTLHEYQGSSLSAVSCPAAEDCYAIGDDPASNGLILTGSPSSSWRRYPGPTLRSLSSVACPSVTVCYVVSNYGDVLETSDGITWRSVHKGVKGEDFASVACPSVNLCFAAGSNEQLSGDVWSSASFWKPNTAGIPLNLPMFFGIACRSTHSCVTVGAGGPNYVVFTTDGRHWTHYDDTGVGHALHAITCVSSGRCVVVGEGGTILEGTP